MQTQTTQQKLQQLRVLMAADQVDAYYLPMEDPHGSEYVPEHWQRLAWLSAFSGSAATIIVTQDQAIFWTDSRYHLQAEAELVLGADGFELYKQGLPNVQSPIEFLRTQAQKSTKEQYCLAIDPAVVSVAKAKGVATVCDLKWLDSNYIDRIWSNRPNLPNNPITLWPEQYAGQRVEQKLEAIRQQLKQKQAQYHVLSALDAIAWTFNIRGTDVPCNPVAISYALIGLETAVLYIDEQKIAEAEQQILLDSGINIKSYQALFGDLEQLQGQVLLDPVMNSEWIRQTLAHTKIVEDDSPVHLLKACKNKTEIQGMQTAHRKDAKALIQFLYWLEHNWQGLDELSAIAKLYEIRQQDDDFRGNSFETICGFADHGAILHYRASDKTNRKIDDSNLLLLDSGGQYLQGTTDVTRTLHLGEPTAAQKRHYTLVLKGHLRLEHSLFVEGTTGAALDAFARYDLWQEGLNFGHGTGHGVGCYLNVHEGPQRVSPGTTVPLKPGMVVSNEPGFYLDHHYGIRIENLCVVTEKLNAEKTLTKQMAFYGFTGLTLVPYAKNLINVDLLTEQEKNWLNHYHKVVYQTLAPELKQQFSADPQLDSWLQDQTAAV